VELSPLNGISCPLTFKDYDLGFVHMNIKHLPKLRVTNGESRKRYLYVASDRCSRWVHLAVLKEAVRAFPSRSCTS
jgi:hypothetical protein